MTKIREIMEVDVLRCAIVPGQNMQGPKISGPSQGGMQQQGQDDHEPAEAKLKLHY